MRTLRALTAYISKSCLLPEKVCLQFTCPNLVCCKRKFFCSSHVQNLSAERGCLFEVHICQTCLLQENVWLQFIFHKNLFAARECLAVFHISQSCLLSNVCLRFHIDPTSLLKNFRAQYLWHNSLIL